MTPCNFRPWRMDPACDLPQGHRGDHHYPAVFPAEAITAPPGAGSDPDLPVIIPNCTGQRFAYQPALFGELFNEEEAQP